MEEEEGGFYSVLGREGISARWTPCARGVQKISDETSQDTTAKHTISGISEEV